MSSIIVRPGQTLSDIAVQHLGSAEGVFALASANGLSVTDELVGGSVVELGEILDKRSARFYSNKINKPSANIKEDIRDGIGRWVVGETFTIT